MAEGTPARDLRGGKASEGSFTILMANLVVAYAADFRSDLFLDIAVGSTVRSEDSGRPVWSLSGTGRVRSENVWGPVLHEKWG